MELVEAVSRIMPNQVFGRPNQFRSHFIVTSSSSVTAGETFQMKPLAFKAAASNSARMAGGEEVFAK